MVGSRAGPWGLASRGESVEGALRGLVRALGAMGAAGPRCAEATRQSQCVYKLLSGEGRGGQARGLPGGGEGRDETGLAHLALRKWRGDLRGHASASGDESRFYRATDSERVLGVESASTSSLVGHTSSLSLSSLLVSSLQGSRPPEPCSCLH